jgi:hypothetical protein
MTKAELCVWRRGEEDYEILDSEEIPGLRVDSSEGFQIGDDLQMFPVFKNPGQEFDGNYQQLFRALAESLRRIWVESVSEVEFHNGRWYAGDSFVRAERVCGKKFRALQKGIEYFLGNGG